MAAPASTDEFLDLVRKSGVTDERRFTEYVNKNRANLGADAPKMAGLMVRDGILTQFQAEQILQGKWRRFTIGKYKVLERIGAGGMGSVYLCEHKLMRRRVAVKVLPTAKATDPSALERFYREARAVAALDHPNIVHAYDIDQDDQLHFLVMEYVDGSNLQDIVKKSGPIDILRACHYMRQAALGLEHAAHAGLVHRDIKPGNILVDRSGTVKILDMGLARFFNDEDDILTKKFDENVLGTADYLAPEQAIDSHNVDIRADIYSLGATFYFMLTGRTPFGEGTVAQKLLWHQTRQPKLVSEYRKDVPQDLVNVIAKMMEKEAVNRYQTPGELAEALAPFCATPIGPPPEGEMPSLSPAALGGPPQDQGADTDVSMRAPDTPPVPKALQAMSSAAMNKPPSGVGSKPSLDTSSSTEATFSAIGGPRSPRPKGKPDSGTKQPPKEPVMARLAPDSGLKLPVPNLPKPRGGAPLPPPAEEQDVWNEFSANSDESSPSAAVFEPVSKPTSAKKAPKPKKPLSAKQKKLILFGSAAVVALGLLIWLGTAVAGWLGKTTDPGVVTPTGRKPLEVTSDQSVKGAYRKIQTALAKAKKGDVIQLNDEHHVEFLKVTSNIPPDVVIRPAPGKHVVWSTSETSNIDARIISLQAAAGLKIQGPDLTLSGLFDASNPNDRLKTLVDIHFASPGLTFENVQFQNFDKSALRLSNTGGDEKNPLRFIGCTFASPSADKQMTAVLFTADPKTIPKLNDFIAFENCQFQVQPQARYADGKQKNAVVGANVKGIELPK